MNLESTWGGTMVGIERETLDFSTPKSPENAFSGIFTCLKLVWKYNFAIFQHILCKTYDESLQKQAVNMDVQCIICIANSIYTVEIAKDKVTCDTYWKFYKKIENFDKFPSKQEILRSNERTGDNLSKQESPVQNGRVGICEIRISFISCKIVTSWDIRKVSPLLPGSARKTAKTKN